MTGETHRLKELYRDAKILEPVIASLPHRSICGSRTDLLPIMASYVIVERKSC